MLLKFLGVVTFTIQGTTRNPLFSILIPRQQKSRKRQRDPMRHNIKYIIGIAYMDFKLHVSIITNRNSNTACL
jgi:hypothetical protein